MKIFLCTKKNILIISLILIIVLISSLCIAFYSFCYLGSELACNNVVSSDVDAFISNVNNLTKGEVKVAYLTFDDGPNISVTPKVLDILKSENVKATFFVIGKYVEKYPDIVKRAYEEGHYIANHGYSHNNSILYKNSESFISEIKKTDLAIGNAIGMENYCSHLFRFPNGFMAPLYKQEKEKARKLLSEIGYTYIDWNCLNNDSVKKYTPNQLLDNLKQSSKNKKMLIILMHDTKDVSNSSLVLKDSIDYLKSQGYEFRNFYECY